MTRKKNRNQVDIEQKSLSKATKTQGQVGLGRSTFIVEIIRRSESQASVGPQTIFGNGSTIAPHVAESSTIDHAKIHNKTRGFEQIFQDTPIKHFSPSNRYEGNSCNLKEGEGEISGGEPRFVEIDLQTPRIGPLAIPVERKSFEIPDLSSVVKPPRGLNINQNPPTQIIPPDHKILENYW